jgi:hypothetical protein
MEHCRRRALLQRSGRTAQENENEEQNMMTAMMNEVTNNYLRLDSLFSLDLRSARTSTDQGARASAIWK